jgi:hypothetical protein
LYISKSLSQIQGYNNHHASNNSREFLRFLFWPYLNLIIMETCLFFLSFSFFVVCIFSWRSPLYQSMNHPKTDNVVNNVGNVAKTNIHNILYNSALAISTSVSVSSLSISNAVADEPKKKVKKPKVLEVSF